MGGNACVYLRDKYFIKVIKIENMSFKSLGGEGHVLL